MSRVANAADAKDVLVLVVLDSDMTFALAAEIAKLRGISGSLPTAMVVGVGYDADFATFAKSRTADLTPPLSEQGRQNLGGLTSLIGDKDGGADAFAAFLVDTLAPEIQSRYPEASASAHHLFGHSLGGLFVAYALLTRPQAFTTFLSSSPSIWWDGFAIMSRLPAFSETVQHLENQPRAFVCVGSKEQDVPTRVPGGLDMPLEAVQALVASSRMVDAAAEFAGALRQAGLAEVVYVPFDGEDHGTVIPPALTRDLAFAVPQPE